VIGVWAVEDFPRREEAAMFTSGGTAAGLTVADTQLRA
jgi:hypothetical protein